MQYWFFAFLVVMQCASSAQAFYTPSQSIKSRFTIVDNLSLKVNEDPSLVPFVTAKATERETMQRSNPGAYTEKVKHYLGLRDKVQAGAWNAANSDMCFYSAGPTIEMNVCAVAHRDYTIGKMLVLYDQAKVRLRANENSVDAIQLRSLKFVENATEAYAKIVGPLCDTDTMDWWGGTGITAAILGCQASFLNDTSFLEKIVALATYDQSKSESYANDTDAFDAILELNAHDSVYVFRNRIQEEAGFAEEKVTVDGYGEIHTIESYLIEADRMLNQVYRETLAYYNDENFPTEDYTPVYDIDGDGIDDTLAQIGRHNLIQTQRNWLAYRDAACQAYSALLFPTDIEHSTWGAFARVQCLTELTRKQVEELRKLRKL